jgi:hypothetical protein
MRRSRMRVGGRPRRARRARRAPRRPTRRRRRRRVRRGVARRDRAHGVERRGDAENVRDAAVGSERQSLRQQIDGAGRRNRPGCRQSARDERAASTCREPLRPTRPVRPAPNAPETSCSRRAVRPGEGHAVEHDRGRGVSGGHGVLPNRESADAADTGASAMRADVHGHAPGGGGRSTVGARDARTRR